jgi:hypothetical protein
MGARSRTFASILVLLGVLMVVPAPAAVADSGEGFVSMTSDPGDLIGQGREWLYSDQAGDRFTWTLQAPGELEVKVESAIPEYRWSFRFASPKGTNLIPGNYSRAIKTGSQPPAMPGMYIDSGYLCNRLFGSFKVYVADYGPTGELLRFAATFEQHCEWTEAALRGEIRLGGAQIPDPLPELPVVPKNPDEDASPAFVNLRGEPREYITAGATVHAASRTLDWIRWGIKEATKEISVSVRTTDGDDYHLVFGAPDKARLTPGEYPHAYGWPEPKPGVPIIDISGPHRGCSVGKGAFRVLVADYAADGTLQRFDADFEHSCSAASLRLRGEIRLGFGPQPPVHPDYPETPGFLELRSDAGDPLLAGGSESFSEDRGDDFFASLQNGLQFYVFDSGFNLKWRIEVHVPGGLKSGTYTQVANFSNRAPNQPAMSVTKSDGDPCASGANLRIGELEIDTANNELNRLELDFDLHCNYGSSGLHGRLRYGFPSPPEPPKLTEPVARVAFQTEYANPALNRSFVFSQPDSKLEWSSVPVFPGSQMNRRVEVKVNVSGKEAGTVMLSAAKDSKLVPGIYRVTEDNDGPRMYVDLGVRCVVLHGRFAVNESAAAPYGGWARLSATFEGKCQDASMIRGQVDLGMAHVSKPLPASPQPVAVVSSRATTSSSYMRFSGKVLCPRPGDVLVRGWVSQGAELQRVSLTLSCEGQSEPFRIVMRQPWWVQAGSARVELEAFYLADGAPTPDTSRSVRMIRAPR